MLSRVEEKYYRNIDKISGSLERIAAALEKANKQNVQDAKGPIEEPIEILSDGTMFVNDIHNVTRVKRVIVNERGTHLCKQFYMDGGPASDKPAAGDAPEMETVHLGDGSTLIRPIET